MTKADWFVLAGFVFLVLGAGLIYRPLAFLVGGALCLLLGNAAASEERKAPKKDEE